MTKYLIEPVQKEEDLDTLAFGNICINDLTFLIKNENVVVGYSQLIPISEHSNTKALWVQKIICNDDEAIKKLLIEIAMYSWELGYDAIFSDYSNSIFKEAGFIELDRDKINVNVIPNKVLALELSWEGLKKFEKTN